MPRFARRIQPWVQLELDAASLAEAREERALAFSHLERAHVLGQAATFEHVRVHWRMLLWALRHRDAGQAAGQIGRLAAATALTGIGWFPQGNTGGADVSAFRRMPIPPDLQRVIDDARR
jgi:Protein of unknown function (DUF3703)